MTDSERKQKFVDDLIETVREAGSKDTSDGAGGCEETEGAADVAKYVLLQVQLARAQAKMRTKAAGKLQGAGDKKGDGKKSGGYFSWRSMLGLDVMSIWSLLAFAAFCVVLHGHRNQYFNVIDQAVELVNQRCLLSSDIAALEMSRSPVNCEMCRNMREMPVEHNMTKELFLKKYAYTTSPVLIKGAVKDWKALKNFSLEFFRDLYDAKPESYSTQNEIAQFFPYKTEFESLREALHMSEERRKKDWYFGWSNFDPDVAQQLREYYSKPHFLPDDAESSHIDWMFMGISAKGAQLHIDYVKRPSWQAQVKGRKIWELVPSPECMSVCHSFNVTVHPGDIICIDTNRWYHATYVYPGDFSATIGSEYD